MPYWRTFYHIVWATKHGALRRNGPTMTRFEVPGTHYQRMQAFIAEIMAEEGSEE